MGRREIIHVIKSWFALIILTIHTSLLPMHTHSPIHTHRAPPAPPIHMPAQTQPDLPTCSSRARDEPKTGVSTHSLRYRPHSLEILWVPPFFLAPIAHGTPHQLEFTSCVPKACLVWSPLDCEQE